LQKLTTQATASKKLEAAERRAQASRSTEVLPLPMGQLVIKHPLNLHEPESSMPFSGNQMSDHTPGIDVRHVPSAFDTIAAQCTLQSRASVAQDDVATVTTTALVACPAQIVQDEVDTTVDPEGSRDLLVTPSNPTVLLESAFDDVEKLDQIVHLWEGNALGIDEKHCATETLNLLNGLLERIERLADWRWPQTAKLPKTTGTHTFQNS